MFRIGGKASKVTALILAIGVSSCSSTKKTNDDQAASEESSLGQDQLLSDLESDETTPTEDASTSTETEGDSPSVEQSTSSSNSNYQFGQSRAPKVINQPFEKDGFVMNAFYVVQSSQESYSSLSELFYGRPERAEMIQGWNSNVTVKPGAIIYYNSHFRFKDSSQMLSFYDDYGFQWTSYQVQPGDSLSGIAHRLYNNFETWKNLAAYNPELTNPDMIQVGMTIKLPPLDINVEAKRQEALAMAGSNPTTTPEAAAPETTVDQNDPATNFSKEMQDEAAKVHASPAGEAAQADKAEQKGLANIEEALTTKDKDKKLGYLGLALVSLTLLLLIMRRRSAKSKA